MSYLRYGAAEDAKILPHNGLCTVPAVSTDSNAVSGK